MKNSIDDLLEERGKVHGEFEANAVIAQHLKRVIHQTSEFDHIEYIEREALDVICSKIARILTPGSDKVDNWRDIAGYATLCLNRHEED